MHMPGFDRAPQRAARRQQAALADHFVQGARAHALGQRTQVVLVDAQQVGRRFCGGSGAGHAAILSRLLALLVAAPDHGRIPAFGPPA